MREKNLIIILLLISSKIFAQIQTIEVYGITKTTLEQQYKSIKIVQNVKIQILEIDNEPVNLNLNPYYSNSEGKFHLILNNSIISNIKSVTSIKLKFSHNNYENNIITIGPIPTSTTTKNASAKLVGNGYIENVEIFLIPKFINPSCLILESFKIDQDISIFEKSNLVQSQSPFRNIDKFPYFHIAEDYRNFKLLVSKHSINNLLFFERIYKEIKPLIIYISSALMKDEEISNDKTLKRIFSDTTGVELFKVLIPQGKSFTANLDSLSSNDITLRFQIFNKLGKVLQNLKTAEFLDPILKKSLVKYSKIFSGNFEPIFIFSFKNNCNNNFLFKQIKVEVKNVEVYLGNEEKGIVPISHIYDIPIEPKAKITELNMNPELLIFRKDNEDGSNFLSFKVRLVPQTPFLHSYLMRFKFHTSNNTEVLTEYFVIDM